MSGETGVKNILPLTMDLANPSTGLGWNGVERLSLGDRGPADLILALALIHYLVFSCCVPLSLVARWLPDLTHHLLVEFVPTSDPMVQKLLVNRGDDHHPYGLEAFRSRFGTYLGFCDKITLPNGRGLFLCRRL